MTTLTTNNGAAGTTTAFIPRTDTTSMWNRLNPVLAAGEMGRDNSLNRIKFGDGSRRWTELPYATGDGRAGPRGADGAAGAPGTAGAVGATGATGPGASSAFISRIAESNVSGHRVVAASNDGRVSHVGKSDADAANIFGITTGAALATFAAIIIPLGLIEEASWAWTAGPVWLGDDGMLTQTLPTIGLLVRVGMATAPSAVIINPQVVAKL